MNSTDKYILNTSMEAQENEFLFEKKEMVYSTDSNNGSYPQGQIIFDLASLSNCGRLCDFKNSTLVIPVVMRLSGTGVTDNVQNCFALSWKNHIHTIDSISCQLSNHSVIEPVEFSNIPASFKLLSEFSKNELDTLGCSYGFHKDNAFSLRQNVADSEFAADGYESNNSVSVSGATTLADGRGYGHVALSPFSGNDALMQRMVNTSLDLTGDQNIQTAHAQVGKSQCRRGAGVVLYEGLITLPLRFLSDFFDKLPLIRNAYVKMSITTNLISRSVIGLNNADTYNTLTHQLSAKCVPYMISEIARGWKKTAGVGECIIESGIGTLSDNTRNNTLTACRLYTPTYTLSPIIESQYFSQGPKQILYNSHFRVVTPVQAPNQQLTSFLVTNGLSRIRSVLIVPIATNAGGTLNNLQSPFSSCPTTTAPYAYVRNFNIRIGGSPWYSENQFYGWEHYQEEIKSLGVNGNLETGLSSGLINQCEWNAAYRYIYVDLTRKASQGIDDQSKSIHLDLINGSALPIQYHVYVCYQKKVTIDVATGQLVIQ